ncbi:hypothetical protein OH76DRAFT_151767 [Lentinus brumalis]|uniref:Uncharacterized protein n=1 Tax=Lentinus brumalis TaxID=2498619 RepID=A0A371CNX9_9APHY|nr:hypothetical protein OH76DRAFT_151767 [Polyporus brumalis]
MARRRGMPTPPAAGRGSPTPCGRSCSLCATVSTVISLVPGSFRFVLFANWGFQGSRTRWRGSRTSPRGGNMGKCDGDEGGGAAHYAPRHVVGWHHQASRQPELRVPEGLDRVLREIRKSSPSAWAPRRALRCPPSGAETRSLSPTASAISHLPVGRSL